MVTGNEMKRRLSTQRSSLERLNSGRIARALAPSLFLAWFAMPSAIPQPSKPTEYDVKAAYLLNFGKFVRQANGGTPRSSFEICILGHDSMGPTIDELGANQTIDNLPVHVHRLSDATDAKGCAIVFISADEGDRLHEDLTLLSPFDVLTVGDAPDFLDRGGMIQFLLVQNHVRFSVNLNAVNRAHLVLSSELLRVASSITGKPSGGGLP